MLTDRFIIRTQGGRIVSLGLPKSVHFEPVGANSFTRRAIENSLADTPVNLPVEAFAARIQAAIPINVKLIGTTPEKLAEGIIETLSPGLMPERIGTFTVEEVDRLTEIWRTFPWRIIPETPLSPATNVALDEVFAKHGAQNPTLRFWNWNHPAVILGRSQSLSNEIDVHAAEMQGLHIVRRITGGGAMFIEPEGAITYSLILPDSAIAGLTIRQSYELCDAWVVRGLRELEIDVHHVPINDLACTQGKIGGAAQARRNGIVIHHATLAYSMNADAMLRVLRIGRESISQRGVRSASKVVAPLNQQTDLPRQAIVDHLLWIFQQLFGGSVKALEPAELAVAAELVESKYATRAWTREVE